MEQLSTIDYLIISITIVVGLYGIITGIYDATRSHPSLKIHPTKQKKSSQNK